jgi:hypothetical protein
MIHGGQFSLAGNCRGLMFIVPFSVGLALGASFSMKGRSWPWSFLEDDEHATKSPGHAMSLKNNRAYSKMCNGHLTEDVIDHCEQIFLRERN